MDKQVIAEQIKLSVTINGQERALQLKNQDLGAKRQDFLDVVALLAESLALELQSLGIVPYTDFAVIDDENGQRTIGERPKRDEA